MSGTARVYGAVLALLAGVVGALFALPASWSDYPDRYPAFRMGRVWLTPYPSTLPALIVMIAIAGLIAARHPATARGAAVVAALAGLQVAGIAVVARRDWWNLAGADGASSQRAAAGSQVALIMATTAVAAVLVSALLYRTGRGQHRPRTIRIAAATTAAVVVAVGVPLWLCTYWHYTSVTAAGQFALWWSLPWSAGLAAAETRADATARRAAALTVFASVLITAFCSATPAIHGFGLRLPA